MNVIRILDNNKKTTVAIIIAIIILITIRATSIGLSNFISGGTVSLIIETSGGVYSPASIFSLDVLPK